MIRRRVKDSIREKIGSMLMFGFRGTASSDNGVQEMIRDIGSYGLGAVALYGYNIESAQQLQSLVSNLKQANPCLLVAVDQEGGKVQRLNAQKGFEETRSAKYISSNYNTEEAYEIYDAMAKMLRSNGINFNLAPCVDVDTQPTCSVIGGLERSYSDDSDMVVRYAEQFILSHESNNVLTALKHFPGHGFAMGDTHKGLVDVTESADMDNEFLP